MIHKLNITRQFIPKKALSSKFRFSGGISMYQYGQIVSNVFRSILRFIPTMARFLKPVTIKSAFPLLKSGREAIIEGVTVKDVIKSALKSTIYAVLGYSVDQIASNLIQMRNNYGAAPSPNPTMVDL